MYCVFLVDEFYRKFWIFFLRKKDEVFSKFVEFKALAEKETGQILKALRSDNGGEYVSFTFKVFCAKEGIIRELITTHNPQQNVVDERKRRSIMGAKRSMLHDPGLPLHLWVEACNTIFYLQNKIPHRILGMITPEEAFSRRNLDVP